MRGDEHQPDEEKEPKATVLPARKAMSLISPDPAAPGFGPDKGQDDEAEPGGKDSEKPGQMLH